MEIIKRISLTPALVFVRFICFNKCFKTGCNICDNLEKCVTLYQHCFSKSIVLYNNYFLNNGFVSLFKT